MRCNRCGHENPPGVSLCQMCVAQGDGAWLVAGHGVTVSAPEVALEPRYAGFWLRAAATAVDTALLTLAGRLVSDPVGVDVAAALPGSLSEIASLAVALLVGNLVSLLLHWLYFTVSESSASQATPGKRLLGLRVAGEDGSRVDFATANRRYWAKGLSVLTLGIGFAMAAFTRRHQALHDFVARTVVVRG